MINHIRTLLLNIDGVSNNTEEFGAEFVVPTYRAVTLPTELRRVWTALFGAAPDRAGRNYRLREFMAILHSAESQAYVLADDARITYNPQDTRFLAETHFPQLTPINGTIDGAFVIGPQALLSRDGRLYYEWRCVGVPDPLANLPRGTVGLPLSWSGTISAPITLPGPDGLALRIRGTGVEEGASVLATLIQTPLVTLAEIPGRVQKIYTESVAQALFGNSAVEPWATFRTWWQESDQLQLRLAGVLLALAHRIELLRQAQGS